jgi:hypothetical protein
MEKRNLIKWRNSMGVREMNKQVKNRKKEVKIYV